VLANNDERMIVLLEDLQRAIKMVILAMLVLCHVEQEGPRALKSKWEAEECKCDQEE